MKKIVALFFGLAVAFSGVLPAMPARAAGDAQLTLSPPNVTVETGEEFSISVLVDPNGELLDTVRVNLSFDASMVEVVWFDLGSQFPSLSPGYELDNDNGEVTFGAFKYGESVTTSGTLATITFRGLSSGTATISVDDDSKLIDEGEEKIDDSTLGSVSVTISGEAVTPTETEEAPTPTGSLEEQALVYFGAFAGRMPSSAVDWEALHCMAYDTCYPSDPEDRRIEHEQTALEIFGAKYGHIPSTSMDWNALHAIAYTEIFYDWSEIDGEEAAAEEETEAAAEEEVVVEEEETTEVSVEAQALVYFGAFAGRLPSTSEEWDALRCIAYDDCTPAERDQTREAKALEVYGAKYGSLPSSSMDWSALHALAYTDVFIDWSSEEEAAEEEATEEEAVETEESEAEESMEAETEGEEEMTEAEAIGIFGQVYGRLPSESADWDAIHIMVEGYDGEQDASAEQSALGTFTSVFGRLPSSESDWNIVAAIAYSGAEL